MRGIITVVIILGILVIAALVSWIGSIYIDVNHDFARRETQVPEHDTRRALGKVIYDSMWKRRERREIEKARRRRQAELKWGRGGR